MGTFSCSSVPGIPSHLLFLPKPKPNPPADPAVATCPSPPKKDKKTKNKNPVFHTLTKTKQIQLKKNKQDFKKNSLLSLAYSILQSSCQHSQGIPYPDADGLCTNTFPWQENIVHAAQRHFTSLFCRLRHRGRHFRPSHNPPSDLCPGSGLQFSFLHPQRGD